MPLWARWKLAGLVTTIISLILLGIGSALHSLGFGLAAVACVLTAVGFMRIGTLKARQGNRS
jgi:hypothetical protein